MRQALVIGAGLSGASCAYSLAVRGWHVTVIEQAAHPAAGASGLPVGLVVPHTSADDTRTSQITRIGIAQTLQRAAQLLTQGQDWQATGVLEHCVEGSIKLPKIWADAESAQTQPSLQRYWSQPATPEQITHAKLPANVPAIWHGCAAWVKPPALIAAMLQHPNITLLLQTNAHALRLENVQWQVLDNQQQVIAQAPIAIMAAGFDSQALLQPHLPTPYLPLNPLRGQVAWQWQNPEHSQTLPPHPVNGKGSFASHIPYQAQGKTGTIWITGSTFQRADTDPVPRLNDIPEIWNKLHVLHPAAAQATQADFAAGHVNSWAGVRATLPDRLPAVGAFHSAQGLSLCCGMGARGLSLAVLAGEVVTAQLNDEPLPLPAHLAGMLDANRFQRKVLRQQQAQQSQP